ncbi:MAG TPA: malto-oligosyltrehalose synthase [Steroidobacteraceae bacterium]
MSASNATTRSARAVPRATYRLQLNREFTLQDATAIVPYLARLGISHAYTSPLLKASPGSMHGYDVTDHGMLNPELGTRADFDRFVATLHEHRLGLIVDIVPNHLGVMGDGNRWWQDVLENGPAARFAGYFDIDWRPNRRSMHNRLLLPVLGDAYGNVLERGEIQLEFAAARGEFQARYHEHAFPIDPREYPRIFVTCTDALVAHEPDETHRGDFESLMNAFAHLPSRTANTEEARSERYRDKESHKRRLARLIERSPGVGSFIAAAVRQINGVTGAAATFDALDGLLETQTYRLAYWRVAADEINYRRFFDVNSLAALRMDDPAVFADAHALILELVAAGAIDGLRIDHSDGLYDPHAYFVRLQRALSEAASRSPFYLVTEKILAPHERLPAQWPISGTTGYEFGVLTTAWLVDPNSEAALSRLHVQFTGESADFGEIAYHSRRLVMRIALAAEVEGLATQLDRLAQQDRHTADFTRPALREAILECIACFPVYRSYLSSRECSEEDRKTIQWAINVARKRSFAADLTVFDFLQSVLLGEFAADHPGPTQDAALEFAMKFQQVTSPVAAKGVEDTALYRYGRLVALNDVGSDPRRYNATSQALHQHNMETARSWPGCLLATSTHDSKRSEDVRARIAVLSEMPRPWRLHVGRWARLNRSKRRQLTDGPAPSRNDEYLAYQTLIGIWDPTEDAAILATRLQEYIIKAAREAKQSTSWLNPIADYEAGLAEFAARLLENPDRNAFLHDFRKLAEPVAWFGGLNSLALLTLKITSPGVADFYQGTEMPTLTLVDPDNRRTVDFAAMSSNFQRLHELRERMGANFIDHLLREQQQLWKLHVTSTLLDLRRTEHELFANGRYEPLTVYGDRQEHLLAFARSHENTQIVVIVPRWLFTLMNGEQRSPVGSVWGDTRIRLDAAQGNEPFIEALSGNAIEPDRDDSGTYIAVANALARFPLAVLRRVTTLSG